MDFSWLGIFTAPCLAAGASSPPPSVKTQPPPPGPTWMLEGVESSRVSDERRRGFGEGDVPLYYVSIYMSSIMLLSFYDVSLKKN